MSVFNVHLNIFSMLTPSFFPPYIIHEVCSEYVPGDSFNHIIQRPIIISETIRRSSRACAPGMDTSIAKTAIYKILGE
jgi:hypothetical protein